MNCTVCLRANLPGGVRCAYCGTHFPPALEFDLNIGEATPASPAPVQAAAFSSAKTGGKLGLLGVLATLAMKAKFLITLFKFGKILTTFGSMLVFIAVYSRMFGWSLAAGFTICIFVHEMGHVFVNWRKGLKQTAPMFIPFMGAVIFIKQFPDDPTVQSESGAGGPAAGGIAALVCLAIGIWTGSAFWLVLAFLGFLINLFNMLPFPPLDGSHMATVFSPKTWGAVLVAILLFLLKAPVGGNAAMLLWGVLVLGCLDRFFHSHDTRHLMATPVVRLRMAVIYLVLCLGLTSGAQVATSRLAALGPSALLSTGARTSWTSPSAPARRSTALARQRMQADARASADSLTPEQWERVFLVLGVAASVVALVFWLITAIMLQAASGRRFAARGFSTAGAMCGLLALLFVGIRFSALIRHNAAALLWAYFLASTAALFFAGYMMWHRKVAERTGLSAMTARCMAWAAGGALLAAYIGTNPFVVVAVAAITGVWYARFRWMAFVAAAHLAESLNLQERAVRMLHRALALKPDAESSARLWHKIALLENARTCGGPALAALEAADSLFPLLPAARAVAAPNSITTLSLKSSAYILLDRYGDALGCCESILQAPPDDPQGAARLWLVHYRLAQSARYRGWWDEALAQADLCLRTMRGGNRLTAGLHGVRALALLDQGKTEEARAACDQALKASREPQAESRTEALRGEISLRAGAPADAEKQTARALRLAPDNLEIRFTRGRALIAAGQRTEGETMLWEMARAYPLEHWGRCAERTLNPPPEPEPSSSEAALAAVDGFVL